MAAIGGIQMAENTTPGTQHLAAAAGSRPTREEFGEDHVLATQPRAEPPPTNREQQEKDRTPHELSQKRATYLSLIALFGGLFVAFTARERGKGRTTPTPIQPFDFLLLALSVFRLARIVSSDPVTEPLRAPVTTDTEDGSEPKGQGAQRALGELVSCPMCIGVWISAALTYGLLWIPGPTRVLLAIFGSAGAAEALNFAMSVLDATTKAETKEAELVDAVTSAS